MAQDRVLRALGRVKKEAEEAPLIFSEEGRSNIQFFGWIAGSCFTAIAAVVVGTSVVVSYKNDVITNKSNIATLTTEVTAIKKLAGEVKDEHARLKPTIEKDHDLIVDLSTQREYGVTNKEWYQRKYNMAAPVFFPPLPPQPQTQAAPTPP